MTAENLELQLDPARLRELFDLSGAHFLSRGGSYDADPYPILHALRAEAPVHEGTPGPLIGFHGEERFQGLPFPTRRHYTALDFETCDLVMRDAGRFTPQPGAHDSLGAPLYETSMIMMEGDQHRAHRALVQPSFVPKRAQWWIDRWIRVTVDALLDHLVAQGGADLNLEYFAPIPLLTICGSFGVSVAEALDIRAAVTGDQQNMGSFHDIIGPIVEARRREPLDDLISVLVQAEITDEHGVRHVLNDAEVAGFALLLLGAGSGTTWKQMGIVLLALLHHPGWLARVKEDPGAMKAVIEETLRWMPTDPVFSRFVRDDTELAGIAMPAGTVVHAHFGAANRDPSRWERPDVFDPDRPPQTHLGFGGGPHICLGMHVARAEIAVAILALLERCPNLRLDPDAPAPRIVGVYERGPDAIPVRWDVP